DLARQYAAYLDKHFSEIDEHNVLDHLRRPAETQKSKLVDHYLKQAHSFGRDYFLREGMKILPATFIAEQQAAIGRISLEASLIIAFFIPESEFGVGRKSNRACLCVVDDQQ